MSLTFSMLSFAPLAPAMSGAETVSSNLPSPPLDISQSSPRASNWRVNPAKMSCAILSVMGALSTNPADLILSTTVLTLPRLSESLSESARRVMGW